ncbi:MAG: outer membrane lipoprotein-sorting protein [Myxococcales bacterium]|nr:outer membrane lipoprotein-sorting protein [Myxococcales bacterium]MDH3484814.1 outer membrane lipoprotein-sorting protein [Myxococcales bacterium]
MNRFVALVLVVMLAPALAVAGPAEDKGLEIAKEADRRDTGFGDTTADMIMTLRNKRGQESKREIEIRTLEVKGDGDKSLTVFHSPRDVRGTALLTYSHGVKPDDQWLYLPALRRVKRIASNNKSGPFMGSEFAYEDLSSQEVEKYKYKYIKDDEVEGVACFLIERYPVDKDSGYTRQQVWIDKDEYRARKIDYYDRKGQLLKTFTPTEYEKFLGKYWRAHKMVMVNHQNGKSTELIWSNFKFKSGLKDSDFTRTRLTQVL